MKKGLVLLLLIAGFTGYAQPGCGNPHRIFTVPKDKTPVVVTRLGTDPQFPIMCNLDNTDLFYKNLQALAEIRQFKDEINNLFIAIGYTEGVKDPRFTRDHVWAEGLPFGAMGMLGDGKNKYVYSLLALPGQTTIKAWHIKALSGCDLYFMNRCGNAFYYSNPVVMPQAITENVPTTAKVKLKIIARCDNRLYCMCDDCGEGRYIRGEVEKAVIADDKIMDIPVTDADDDYPVKKIYIDVDKHTFKQLRSYDVNGKYDKHKCDDNCTAENGKESAGNSTAYAQ